MSYVKKCFNWKSVEVQPWNSLEIKLLCGRCRIEFGSTYLLCINHDLVIAPSLLFVVSRIEWWHCYAPFYFSVTFSFSSEHSDECKIWNVNANNGLTWQSYFTVCICFKFMWKCRYQNELSIQNKNDEDLPKLLRKTYHEEKTAVVWNIFHNVVKIVKNIG